jgi:acyl-coenzyme A synthetase/AMP-(fatty) acid ligase
MGAGWAGNAAEYFVDRHIAEGRGAATAFEEVDGATRQLTYAELADHTARFAGLWPAPTSAGTSARR